MEEEPYHERLDRLCDELTLLSLRAAALCETAPAALRDVVDVGAIVKRLDEACAAAEQVQAFALLAVQLEEAQEE